MLRVPYEMYNLRWFQNLGASRFLFSYFLVANLFVQGINDLFLPKIFATVS